MTRDETKTLLATMAAVYSEKLMSEITELTVNVWFKLLQDIDYKAASAATAAWLTSNKYPPTISDIRELVIARKIDQEIGSAEEAWGKLQTAVRKHGWTEEGKAKDVLGELVWKTVGSFGWKYWCQMPIESEATYFAQFRNAYNVNRKREIDLAQIPDCIREKLPAFSQMPRIMPDVDPIIVPLLPEARQLNDEELGFKAMMLGDEYRGLCDGKEI